MSENTMAKECYTKRGNCYFAAANGGVGFISYFDRVFDNADFDRIYILKGGPGTGKSSLMKKAAALSIKHGHSTESILCSSDPESLDGIIINKNGRRIAIIDGTAPHVREAKSPGAVDEIVNLGDSWDPDKLRSVRHEIEELQRKKQIAYTTAYSILHSAYTYQLRKRSLLEDCIDREKLKKTILRLLPQKSVNIKHPKPGYKLKNAISVHGPCSCEIYEENADSTISVYGSHGGSFAVLREILNVSNANNLKLTLSPSPLDTNTIDAISLDDYNVCFIDTSKDRSCIKGKAINSERFLYQNKLREIKPELRLLSRLYEDSMKAAYKVLASAKEYHFALEDIYIKAMDFKKKEKIEELLFERIFD